jgi:DnaJ family protein C protein 9
LYTIFKVIKRVLTIGSEEEEEDLLEAYKTYKGNMDKILEVVECSTAEDGERFAEIIKKAIKSKLVPSFKSFETTTTPQTHKKRIEKAKKAEIEFEKAEQKKKKGKAKTEKEEESDLLALIQARNKDRHANMNSIIESIEAEAKAKKGGKKRKQKEVDDMPSEEEFLKLQESLFNKKGKKSKK